MINNILTIGEAQGQCISIAGGNYRVIISGAQTQGAYAVIDMLVPPGEGPNPHSHTDINETFYVVEGEVEFKTEAGKYIAQKGAFINIPKGGEVHCFKNKSDKLAHLVCTVTPAGLDEFFQAVGKPVDAGVFLHPAPPTQEELAKLTALGEKYGQKFFPPDYLG